MKNIRTRLVELLRTGCCTPQIAKIARATKEPATTIHYNVKKLEEEKAIVAYKAVFDHQKIDQGFCAFVMISISSGEYGNPERIAKELVKNPNVESVDVCTGTWEIIVKIRAKDQAEYYELIKKFVSRKGIRKIITISSLKQLKSEFLEL
ncbi:Lrp/AsnC family transcriptional regulator [Candidatus Micrarchaeota archaeon]|nr:Lrp/AsnC family transcriptional regulator [Candidatus Micrarchaeota archaeon]MBU1165873.1 Lrp/AsnC family transcriptional regulator [Candidatus Micrarchaeota archaeon]MBU1886374.1 Lrp/AsnC family transcriptional regulator [Candidatus Micrarchaeota archaeon]